MVNLITWLLILCNWKLKLEFFFIMSSMSLERYCGRSSGVEHNLAKVGVEGSNPFARSIFPLSNYCDRRRDTPIINDFFCLIFCRSLTTFQKPCVCVVFAHYFCVNFLSKNSRKIIDNEGRPWSFFLFLKSWIRDLIS